MTDLNTDVCSGELTWHYRFTRSSPPDQYLQTLHVIRGIKKTCNHFISEKTI